MKSSFLITQAQLEWACKRGMLECELFLIPFIKAQFDYLSEDEKSQLYELLQYPDPLLYAWLMNIEPIQEAQSYFRDLIKKIQDYRSHAIA